MKQRSKKDILLLGLLFLYIILFIVFIADKLLKYSESITAGFLILLVFFSSLLLGFQKDKSNILKKNIFNLVLSHVIIYFVVIYVLGLFLGFLKTPYNLSLFGIFNNILAPFVTIVCSELFRYILISTNKDKKDVCILVTILLIFLELTFNLNVFHFGSLSAIFKLVASALLPISIKNAVLSYLVYHVGYKPCLVYRLLLDMYIYILPIVPDLGDYLECLVCILLPVFIYLKSSSLIEYYDKTYEHDFKQEKHSFSSIPLLLVVIVLAVLSSGFFPWKLLGVGSDSMNPEIYKGDAILAVKTDVNKLKKGDIIVFLKEDKQIIHRISDIIKEDGETYFITKGDNNNKEDNWQVVESEIQAKVYGRIPYIAYPSIYIRELIKER